MIGRAYIALAELVKNSYDADAIDCRIDFNDNEIIIHDDGHGMSESEFLKHWMRIGTTHKGVERQSRNLGRPMTGSKGLGRLSVQFLADEMTLETTSSETPSNTLYAIADWSVIQHGNDLSTFEVLWETRPGRSTYVNHSQTGTRITLGKLRTRWDQTSIEALGRELAVLRSPFKRSLRQTVSRTSQDFYVNINAPNISSVTQAFDRWQEAFFANWKARIKGTLNNGRDEKRADIELEFKAGFPDNLEHRKRFRETIYLPIRPGRHGTVAIDTVKFEILIFKPERRQPGPLRVGEMRDYLRQFGNVSVYDSGFRLPYYGSLEDKTGQDWLNIAIDQGRRLTVSELLPARLRGGDRYLLDLPAPGRILGVVDIDTNRERDIAMSKSAQPGEWLVLQPGRDRLASNVAFEQLRDLVRFSLDFYASRFALLAFHATERKRAKSPPSQSFSRALATLERNRTDIPKAVYGELKREVVAARGSAIAEEQALDKRAVLLAPLASAGVVALALNHELARESRFLRRTGDHLRRIAKAHPVAELNVIASEFEDVFRRLHSLRELFSPLLSDVDEEVITRLKVRPIVDHVVRAMQPLMPGVSFEKGVIQEDLRFPVGSFAEWSAILQNVFSNAWNAMLESSRACVLVSGGHDRRYEWLRVSDTGVGLGLPVGESSSLFEPFERRMKISNNNRSVAMGGHGLGLSIVRMIARQRSSDVQFMTPEAGFATTFQISWIAT